MGGRCAQEADFRSSTCQVHDHTITGRGVLAVTGTIPSPGGWAAVTGTIPATVNGNRIIYIYIYEVWGVKPMVPRPGIRIPSSTSSCYRVARARRMTCVTCRARDVTRATDQ